MISFIVRMRYAAEDREVIEEALRALTAASREEPGCISYVPHFVEGDDFTILIYEQYKDEAALEQHRATVHFQQYAVAILFQKMLERQIENLTAIA